MRLRTPDAKLITLAVVCVVAAVAGGVRVSDVEIPVISAYWLRVPLGLLGLLLLIVGVVDLPVPGSRADGSAVQAARQPVVPKWPGRFLTYTKGQAMMSGPDVRMWQAQMGSRGWSIKVDGNYGPGSEHVARRFQEEKHLRHDGVVGPETWTAAWVLPISSQ